MLWRKTRQLVSLGTWSILFASSEARLVEKAGGGPLLALLTELCQLLIASPPRKPLASWHTRLELLPRGGGGEDEVREVTEPRLRGPCEPLSNLWAFLGSEEWTHLPEQQEPGAERPPGFVPSPTYSPEADPGLPCFSQYILSRWVRKAELYSFSLLL